MRIRRSFFSATLLLFLAFMLSAFTINIKKPYTEVEEGHVKIKFVLRHAGGPEQNNCSCPSCKCPGCPCPIGMCACGGVAMVIEDVDMGDDVGTADAWFESGQLHLSFDQVTGEYNPNLGTDAVPITGGSVAFSTVLANHFGYSSVTIPQGYYQVDYNGNPYGKIVINAICN